MICISLDEYIDRIHLLSPVSILHSHCFKSYTIILTVINTRQLLVIDTCVIGMGLSADNVNHEDVVEKQELKGHMIQEEKGFRFD